MNYVTESGTVLNLYLLSSEISSKNDFQAIFEEPLVPRRANHCTATLTCTVSDIGDDGGVNSEANRNQVQSVTRGRKKRT